MSEQCKNPMKPKCKNTNIKLYIVVDKTTDEQIPICENCWIEIADADIEW